VSTPTRKSGEDEQIGEERPRIGSNLKSRTRAERREEKRTPMQHRKEPEAAKTTYEGQRQYRIRDERGDRTAQ